MKLSTLIFALGAVAVLSTIAFAVLYANSRQQHLHHYDAQYCRQQLRRNPIHSLANTQNISILVTGGAGFIGYHVISSLLQVRARKSFPGLRIISLDTYNNYYVQSLKHMRINELVRKDASRGILTVYNGDVCDRQLLSEILRKHRVTHVLHLAAQAGVRFSLESPQKYVTENVMCTVELLEEIRQYDNTVGFVYASSSSVYGNNKKIPFSEIDPVDQPSNVYGATKRMDELLGQVYSSLYQLRAIGLRFFTVLGEYGRPDMALYRWTDSIVRGEPIVLYQRFDPVTGQEMTLMRDFTAIDDVVQGILSSLGLVRELDAGSHRIYNLGNNNPEKVTDLIDIIADEIGIDRSKLLVRRTEMPAADIPVTFANITLANRDLAFEPKTSVKEITHRFMQWYRDTFYPEHVLFTTYFTTQLDPQRGVRQQADDFEKMRLFFESVHHSQVHTIIFHDNLSEDFVNHYTTRLVRFVRVVLPAEGYTTNDARFMVYLDYLRNITQSPVSHWMPKYVLTTDLFDVVINKDPFVFMREEVQRRDQELLFVGSEEKKHVDLKWLTGRFESCGIGNRLAEFVDQPLNGGIVGGPTALIMDLFRLMTEQFKPAVNCNTPILCVIARDYFQDVLVTGAPLHSPFREEIMNTQYFIKHK